MIYSIADLHFDDTGDKSMDIFGENWKDHENNIIENWNKIIKEDDLVLIPGDISWALKSEDAYVDLKKIDELPGKKVISKGNHDYWWQSLNKINQFEFSTLNFLQNNSFIFNGIGITGTRGWSPIDRVQDDSHDKKIYLRELNRLKLSLESLEYKPDKIITMLHYPPFNSDLSPNEFVDLMKEYDVDICIYGHLHSEGHRYAVEGMIEGIEFHLIASDFIDFIPKQIL